jgi:hypothetical protein
MVLVAGGACAGDDPSSSGVNVSPGEASDDLGKADGDTGPRSELKVTVDRDAVEGVADYLGLASDLAEQRAIWFYDTPDLALFEAGAILRARKVTDDDDDSTAKLRPLTADQVDAALFQDEHFKCETDWTPTSSVSSCSFGRTVDTGEIDEVGDGERDIDSLFSSDQEEFLIAYGPAFDWDELAPLGPVPAQVWKVEHDDLPGKMTAELWRLPFEDFLELSVKVPDDEAEDAFTDLLDWLSERNVPLSSTQETKTRRALEILTGQK